MSKKLPDVTFYNGQKMPLVGLGTWQAKPEEISTALDKALELGYRHIDTAFMYENEAAIGKTLKKWFDSGKLKREDIFIVTKLPMKGNRAESVDKYMKKSLAALQLTYVDLYLIHGPAGFQDAEGTMWPVDASGKFLIDYATDHISLWKAMEAQVDAGRARAIGLSNFNSRQIARIVKIARIRPANIQVELHVHFQQRELVAFCRALDITVCAYGPIGSPALAALTRGSVDGIPKEEPLKDPVVCQIGKKHNKTPAQVLLRYIMQKGIAVIPKSSNPSRIEENFQVFDFELTEEEMEEMDNLDKRRRGRRFRAMKTDHPESPFDDPY